jgi:hypothetical protein
MPVPKEALGTASKTPLSFDRGVFEERAKIRREKIENGELKKFVN